MKIQLNSPINSLSLGNVSFNIARELIRSNSLSAFFPEKDNLDLSSFDSADDQEKLKLVSLAQDRIKKFKEKTPTLKIWHINGSEYSVGSKRYLYTFYEVDEPTIEEINLVANNEAVFFSSSASCKIFQDRGLTNVYHIPLGFDEDILKERDNARKLDGVIHFGLIGKLEKRKNTQQIIKLWLEKYGNDPKYQLTCLVENPFFEKRVYDEIINQTLGGKHWNNINFLPRLSYNSEVNQLMNSIDIDLSGCNFNEGWNLPSFNAACLGKICVVGMAMGHLDWAKGDNIVPLHSDGKKPCYDGVFFKEGLPFNQGSFYTVEDESITEAFDVAVSKFKSIKTSELRNDLIECFSYKNTVDKLMKVVYP